MPETPNDILRALVEPERLQIAGSLARGDGTSASLAEELGLSVERTRRHLTRLAAVGVVRVAADRRTYRLDPETLRWAASQVGPPRDANIPLGAATDEEGTVLRAFFRDGRLVEIPTKRSKRLIVLERIAIEFEPGRRFHEREVNVMLAAFHLDVAALRRALVDEGLLDRDHGEYWRAGGHVQVDP